MIILPVGVKLVKSADQLLRELGFFFVKLKLIKPAKVYISHQIWLRIIFSENVMEISGFPICCL